MNLVNPIIKQKITSLISRPWFFPLIICILVNSLGLLLTLYLEQVELESSYLSVTFEKHSAIMSVIGSSLMTLIGVTFSISMLILSSLSSQFGPRLLPNVLHSRITQVTLGFFLATFIFTLFCLYFDSSVYSKAIQSIYVLILAIVCIIILISFVNYVMDSIQVDFILQMVRNNTKEAIQGNYIRVEDINYPEALNHALTQPKQLICVDRGGYIEAIDYDTIARLAEKYQSLVDIRLRPGDFVIQGNLVILLYAHPHHQPQDTSIKTRTIEQAMLSCIRIGQSRILNQDIEFGYEQIAEIAVRALSPGINDPYTARHCLWVLADLFICVDGYHIESHNLYNQARWVGKFKGFTYEGLVDSALSRIRQASEDDMMVMLTCYDMIIKLIPLLKKRRFMRALLRQAQAISHFIDTKAWTNLDKIAIEERQTALQKVVKQFSLQA